MYTMTCSGTVICDALHADLSISNGLNGCMRMGAGAVETLAERASNLLIDGRLSADSPTLSLFCSHLLPPSPLPKSRRIER